MIEIKNLCKKYEKNGCVVHALDNVEVTLPDKGLVLVTGKNGSGKTTFLNMIGLIDEPDRGSIIIDGKDILQLRGIERDEFRASRISYVFQTVNLINSLTAKENLLLVKDDGKAIADNLSMAEIAGCTNKFPSQMSQGQIQKVSIIRAMLGDTAILLADEPTSALDVDMKGSVAEQLKRASQSQLVIVVTHDTDLNWQEDIKIIFDDGKADIEAVEPQRLDSQEQDSGNIKTAKCRNIKPNLALKFGLRSIKSSLISSIIFAIFSLITYVAFALLTGCPINDEQNILAKVYDENGNRYVIAYCYDDIPDNATPFSKFSNETFKTYYSIDEHTPLWYAAAGYKNISHSGVANQSMIADSPLVLGRLADGKGETVITDYLADCMIEIGLDGHRFANYQDVISNGSILLRYDDLQVNADIVGIVKTKAADYKSLANYNTRSLSNLMQDWQDDHSFLAESQLDGEFVAFLYRYQYEYCLCYIDGALDGEIAKMSNIMSVSSQYNAGGNSVRCTAIGKSSALSDGIYPVSDADVTVSLSTLIDADDFYRMISEGISSGMTSTNVISQYVASLPEAYVEVYGEQYSVGAYCDDFASETTVGAVYFPQEVAEEIFSQALNMTTGGAYAVKASGNEIHRLSGKYSIFFPQYDIAMQSAGKYNMVFYGVLIACAVLLLLTAIFIISDVTMYCASYSKQLAVMLCIGISKASITVTAFAKYLIIMAISYVLSFAVSLPLIFTLSDIVTSPFKTLGFITFSPLSILLSAVYTGVIFAIAYVFGLNKIKRRSLSALLR